MDKSKIKTKEVWSASNEYLFFGIIFICLIIVFEGCAIREFFVSQINEAIGTLVILQVPCFYLFCWSTIFIKDWIHRTIFTLYYCKLETEIDIDYIKANYSVEDINSNGVLFVKKEDTYNFSSWKLLQGYKSLDDVEIQF